MGVDLFIEKVSIKGKDNYLIFVLVIIGLMVIFSYSMGSDSAATVYVNAASGNDGWNGLSPVHTTGTTGPNKDISTGITHVNSGGTLKIANGLYTGTKNYGISISKNMNVQGQSVKNTVINAGNHKWIFSLQTGSNVSLSYLTLTQGNTAGIGGAINNKGTLTVSNCNFENNSATNNGGAITNTGSLTVKKSIFTGNNGYTNGGAAIYNAGKTNVIGSNFVTNGHGGAIENTGNLDVTGGNFISNSIKIGGDGAAIYNTGVGNVVSSNFTGNTMDAGGAIYNHGILSIISSNFKSNTGYFDGGAIDNNGNLNVKDSNFTNNFASFGGAIYNEAAGILTITGSTFKNNSALNDGGAIYNSGSANVNFNRIVGNTANIGRAVYLNSGTVDATDNWWGSNANPKSNVYGNVKVTPWLVLTVSPSPTTIATYAHSTITVDLLHDNQGNEIYDNQPDGIPVSFSTTLGSIGSSSSTLYGFAESTLAGGPTAGIATVSAKMDNQIVKTLVKVVDTTPPKVVSTTPTNGATGFSKTANITIKFSENIKSSINWSKIVVIDKYGQSVHITPTISVNTIFIQTNPRAGNSWYTVTIPASAVKDYSGNNLLKSYTFKFKTS